MDVITPPIRCSDFNDGLPIVIPTDWIVEDYWVIYRPLGVIFEVALQAGKVMSEAPEDYNACLTYQEDMKPLPDMAIIRKLGKKAIHAYLAEYYSYEYDRATFPDPHNVSAGMASVDVSTFDGFEDDIPF